MKLRILETVICRTPAFCLEDSLKENWEALKYKIKEASPSFFDIIATRDSFEVLDLNNKIDFTIWKYFNRAKYRATPFGSFAAFTAMPLAHDNEPIVLAAQLSPHCFIDWDEKDTHTANVRVILKRTAFLHTNTTIYYVGNEVRYLNVKNGSFEIASVTLFEQLKFVLAICRDKVNKEAVYSSMGAQFQMNESETSGLLHTLITHQLLLTDLSPNITGEDYFTRLNKKRNKATNNYIIAERMLISGGLGKQSLKNLPALITFLSEILPNHENSNLDQFRKAFLKKFDHKEIPLAIAMDPEIGIGYGNLEQMALEDELLNALNSPAQSAHTTVKTLPGDLHSFILNRLISGGQIQIDEFSYSENNSKIPLPNTFNVMLHLWEGRPVIENAGGCSATALLGRFTLANTAIENYGRHIASMEQIANPDIIFFDIAYQAEKHIDNVNRRRSLYEKELPILTWSCFPHPLSFDDILISVRGSEIILRSKKDGKRMVPRLPSAYNYTRSDLAAYRFLCDIQQQNIKADLNFRLKDHFPDLTHYPRVVYKDIIISPAMWKVPVEYVNHKKNEITGDNVASLRSWLEKKGINFMFKAGHADNYLCFDPGIEDDMTAFLVYCRQQDNKAIYITEALINKSDGVQDDTGKSYVSQYIVGFSHEILVYSSYSPALHQEKPKTTPKAILLPGGDWLYFEIYGHPARSNSLLLNQISDFLKESGPHIKKWFFIRYYEQGHHIRLRLQLKEESLAYPIITSLKTLLEPEIYNGTISDFSIKSYFREIDRYGADRIELVEKFFWIDSQYALFLLKRTQHTDQLYATTLMVMQRWLSIYLNTIDQLAFAKNMADNFAAEMQMNSSTYKMLNLNFNQLKDNILRKHIPSAVTLAGKTEKIMRQLFQHCGSGQERSKMTADLIHMHINRLFISDQRKHEAILYHYLVRTLHIRRAVPSS